MEMLLMVSLKTLATIAIAVMTCGTTIMVFIGTIGINYIKSIRDNMTMFHASRIEHGTKLDSLDKRTTRIEDKIFP